MIIEFTKMHGAMNDFVMIDDREEKFVVTPEITKHFLDRRGGIGGDQLLIIRNAADADFEMKIYNADGSEVEMCGNGVRCAALFANKLGIENKNGLSVKTLAGIKKIEMAGDLVRVDMGPPEFEGSKIPVNLSGEIIDRLIEIDDISIKISCASMGNPHCVIDAENPDEIDIGNWGPVIESLPIFPNRTNIEFIKVLDRKNIRMRVWERGAGETPACGTGACASAVLCMKRGLVDDEVTIHLDGGKLTVGWPGSGSVFLTGPAVFVYEGKIEI